MSLWKNATFVFDTNVILNIYRYTPETRDKFLDILERLQNRLWLPYQVASEYHERRLTVISQQMSAYTNLENDIVSSFQKAVTAAQNQKRHSFINADEIISIIENAKDNVLKSIQKSRQEHPDLLKDDALQERIALLFEDRVGIPYEEDKIPELHDKAEKRIASLTPPGYKDAKKPGEKPYGDVLIWFQIIGHAKETQKPIIFVTDDAKEDWWLRHEGRTIGPRPELIQEIIREAKQEFYMYQSDRFIEEASKFLEINQRPEVIEEVKTIKESEAIAQNQHQENLSRLLKIQETFERTRRASQILKEWERQNGRINQIEDGYVEQFKNDVTVLIFSPHDRDVMYLISRVINSEFGVDPIEITDLELAHAYIVENPVNILIVNESGNRAEIVGLIREARKYNRSLNVMALTSRLEHQDTLELKLEGANSIQIKPINVNDMLTVFGDFMLQQKYKRSGN